MPTIRIITLLISVSLLAFTSTACQRAPDEGAFVQEAYRQGDFRDALTVQDKRLGEAMPSGRYEESREASCLLLDAALLHLSADEPEEATKLFRSALEAIDFYRQAEFTEEAGQYLLDDRIRAYTADDYEANLARVYLALTLWQLGDESNAYALLRQAEEQGSQLGLAKALFACACLRNGDKSNARILHQQAEALNCRLPLAGGRDKPLLLLVCHNGCVPLKASHTLQSSDWAGLLMEEMLSTAGVQPAFSSLTGVSVPNLDLASEVMPERVSLSLDGKASPLCAACDVSYEKDKALAAALPSIATRAAIRHLLRRGAVAAAKKKDEGIGVLADLAALFANVATQADTRSWGTLPARIDASLQELTAGEHTLNLHTPGYTLGPWQLSLPPGSLCVVHWFKPNPYSDAVIIPNHYLLKETL